MGPCQAGSPVTSQVPSRGFAGYPGHPCYGLDAPGPREKAQVTIDAVAIPGLAPGFQG